MNNEKINQALETYIKQSIELRKLDLDYLKSIALTNWDDICNFKETYCTENILVRFYFNGKMALFSAKNPSCYVWIHLENFLIWNYNSDLLNLIRAIAGNSDLCSNVTSVIKTHEYDQIEITFK